MSTTLTPKVCSLLNVSGLPHCHGSELDLRWRILVLRSTLGLQLGVALPTKVF